MPKNSFSRVNMIIFIFYGNLFCHPRVKRTSSRRDSTSSTFHS
uniref:Uncharacterized protein n=1 Tax=Lepeophtheirus salmonis TaxID=72036 RepID=A0A0K2US36_LEPSM